MKKCIIFLGFAIFPKKSGQIFIANLPGNCDAFLPNNLITAYANFDNINAI